jgi:hypothetical protein
MLQKAGCWQLCSDLNNTTSGGGNIHPIMTRAASQTCVVHDNAAGSFAALSAIKVQVVEGILQNALRSPRPQCGIFV